VSNIKPFQAIYYNSEKIPDMTKVVSPPYDVISPEKQEYLHDLSPYNFTHIDYAKDFPGESSDDKYSRVQQLYSEWLQQGVMVQDDQPSIYFYKQDYKIMGQKHSRMGFISLMELDSEESRIYPHENTHAEAVNDRFRICEALKSNLSCIFVCYSDLHKRIEKIFTKNVLLTNPIIEVEDDDLVRHKLWRLSDPDLIAQINESLSGQHLFIADGHHRYKVAMEYRDQNLKKASSSGTNGQKPFNYVMTYFTNMDSRDLQIFPMHRIVKHLPQDLGPLLEEFFRVDKIKMKEDLPILLARAGRNEHAFGLYTRDDMFLLRLKNRQLVEEYVNEGSTEYKNLDATILKTFIFDRVGVESSDIIYVKDIDKVMEMVDESRADAGFVMNPVSIAQLRAIALNGEKMPPKTTYFYPKVLSGLTVYKMD